MDYVTKPFQVDEVQARVQTHLEIHQLQKELQGYANHLEELVAARTRELAETQERLKLLDRAKERFPSAHPSRVAVAAQWAYWELVN